MNIDRLYGIAVALLAKENEEEDLARLVECREVKFAAALFDVPESWIAQQVLALADRLRAELPPPAPVAEARP